MARRKKGNPVHGWVNIDKPLGMTSTQVVGRVRRIFNAQKAGHAGTLDPLASGILPIALGEATKTVPFMMEAVKQYEVRVVWGECRDTCDGEGEVIASSDHRPSQSDILKILPQFTGVIDQTPPRYSAIKIDGKRAYDLARAGEAVELKSRQVRIDGLELMRTETNGPQGDWAELSVTCGKGTYIRSLARDMGRALGGEAYVGALRRTQVGVFYEKDAFLLDDLENFAYEGGVLEGLRPVETVLDDIPVHLVTDKDESDLRHGRAITLSSDTSEGLKTGDIHPDHLILARTEDKAVALGQMRDGWFHPKRVFNM